MKEKIERLAKGIFEYKLPDILLSDEVIELSIQEDTLYQGKLTIKASDNRMVKGIVYSSNQALHVIHEAFVGEENIIEYEVSSLHRRTGERIEGELTIVSDLGEKKVPYKIEIQMPFCTTSNGNIRDLYQFTDLAKLNWHEALSLFKSENFTKIFLSNDKENILYQSLVKGRNSSIELEEFLIAMHKKERVSLSVDKLRDYYYVEHERVMDKIVLTKNNWGYMEIRTNTDSAFIELDHKIIWTDNFLGSTFSLEYVLKPEFMRDGKNYGRIFIQTVHQTFIVEISCNCNKSNRIKDNTSMKLREMERDFVKNYLDFRLGHITVEDYQENMRRLVIEFHDSQDSDYRSNLIRLHLSILSGDKEKTKLLIDHFSEHKEEMKIQSMRAYCAFLYLNALFSKAEDVIEEALKEITDIYETGTKGMDILWYLIYLDKQYDQNKSYKLEQLVDEYKRGCKSPILYFELYSIYKEDANLLQSLSEVEIQVIYWILKNDLMSEEIAEQFIFLASRQKSYKRLVYISLTMLYKKIPSKDILAAICSMLIKGHKIGSEYFEWYQLGVKEQLRITELYEYYMYSIEESTDNIDSRGVSNEDVFESQVLLYYLYNSNLNDKKKAYLYSKVVQDKEKNSEMYQSYSRIIEQFVVKQLKEQRISRNLSILYEDMLKKKDLDDNIYLYLSYVAFQYEIQCANQNIRGLYVVHKEIEEEKFVPLIDGHAVVSIYSTDAYIILVDKQENRYVTTVDYTMYPFLNVRPYLDKCYECSDIKQIVLTMMESPSFLESQKSRQLDYKVKALEIPNIRKKYQESILKSIFYEDSEYIEEKELMQFLDVIDITNVRRQEINPLLEFYMRNKEYDKVYKVIREYGSDEIDTSVLLTYCNEYLANSMDKNDIILSMCYRVLLENRENEQIVRYLLTYYTGSTNCLLKIYHSAIALKIDCLELAERLLAQILFANSMIEESYEIFYLLYQSEKNDRLKKAYLTFIANEWIMNERTLPDELYEIMKQVILKEENEIILLAVLKRLSIQEELSGEEVRYVEVNLDKLVKKGILLTFFKNFIGKVKLEDSLLYSQYIEYKTNPKQKVFLHYVLKSSIEEEEKEQIIEMKNMYGGIYVSQFLLFYGEKLEYFIVEDGKENGLTEEIQVTLDNKLETEDEVESKYNQINLMLMAKELNDDETLYEMMKHYKKKEAMASILYSPLS
ncbi:DUF5717 family protein [Anaeromicropila herbilytica]|uniref:DUF5717 domain-containing protein n=1 Tax=Anaeromicropila herbilytica TaxID=2785025 RepID=A0A7R7ICK3_9FIRM|nr:DUF5717 family protein [Anaeromicropila herbilytica]BCN30019.1 hypothetical protein bsdtb5_13140 [Anaeromicropila herbilytica]